MAPSLLLGKKTIGIRIPENWFSEVVEEMGVPVITSSANRTGDDFMTKMEDLDSAVKNKVDLIVYEGEIAGKPSTLVIIDQEVEIRKREK